MPWESALSNLDFFSLMFDRSEVYGPMKVCFLSDKHISIANKRAKSQISYLIPIFMELSHFLKSVWLVFL